MHEGLPDDFAERIAQLVVDGVIVEYLRPRPIELVAKKRPPWHGVDLDVVLLDGDGHWRTIDFAIPEIEDFKQKASSGALSLNDRTYLLHWLDREMTAQVEQAHFETVGDDSNVPERARWPEGRLRNLLNPFIRRPRRTPPQRTEPDSPQ